MLAAEKGHKDVVLLLTQKGANLDLVNGVSVYVCTTLGWHLYQNWNIIMIYLINHYLLNNCRFTSYLFNKSCIIY